MVEEISFQATAALNIDSQSSTVADREEISVVKSETEDGLWLVTIPLFEKEIWCCK
jgi:hypothetical protein